MVMEKYSEQLKKILLATGWSQEVLAGKIGVSFVTLNNWINEKSLPREQAAEKIHMVLADVVGTDVLNRNELIATKKKATTHRYSVKKLLSDQEFLEKITTSLTYHSNGTEGSTMTEQDIASVVYNNQILRNRTSLEQREAINHQAALYFLLDELLQVGDDFSFTPELIKAVHLRLMNGIVSDAGYFRNHGVRISGSHTPVANFIKVPELISAWCNKVNEETTDPIGLMAQSHAEFEKIHPFSDGNGRTGRILLFALALKLEIMPPVLHKERRYAYYKYLELAQTRETYDSLELFIAKAILETAETLDD